MGAANKKGELVEGNGVLLRDKSEQLPISFRDLKAATVPACSPPASSRFEDVFVASVLLLSN